MQSEENGLAGLVRLAKAGQEDALAELILRFHRHVYQTAYAVLRSRLDAEEVSQDTFLRMYQKLHTLQDEHAFYAWLTTTTTRLAIDHARRTKKHQSQPLEDVPETLAAFSPDPAARTVLSEALDRLSTEHRAILLLRERDGYEYQEIADILKIPIGTVKSRLANAKKSLRMQLYERDGDQQDEQHGR